MIETRHTDEEKEACVNEYLNSGDKYYLSGKYSTSVRTVDRWIKKFNDVEWSERRIIKNFLIKWV